MTRTMSETEEKRRVSEITEREVMMPAYEPEKSEDNLKEMEGFMVRVYLHGITLPKVSFFFEERIGADAFARKLLIDGILDLDGEYIPAARIFRLQLEEFSG